MSGLRFRRATGGVCSLGLHLVWCPKYRRRVLGGRVARRLGGLIEQIADEHGWQIVAQSVSASSILPVELTLGMSDLLRDLPFRGRAPVG